MTERQTTEQNKQKNKNHQQQKEEKERKKLCLSRILNFTRNL